MNDSEALLLADRLAPGGAKTVKRLGGSGNSRVYQVESVEGSRYAAKFYLCPTAEGRDRLEVEVNALDFLHREGLVCVPRHVVRDRAWKVLLMEYIEGHPLSSEEVSEGDMEEMAAFLVLLKRLADKTPYEDFYPASEAWFSVAAGEQNILGRLVYLEAVEGDGPVFKKFSRFLKEHLRPAIEEVVGQIRRDKGENDYEEVLGRSARTLSPSDFGIHNALRCPDGKLTFLDFEYFGWDDPAKMISDFLLHPGMDLSHELKTRFSRTILEGFNQDRGLQVRLKRIYPLCGLKWCTILLNEFRSGLFEQRCFAAKEKLCRQEVLSRQLNKSDRMLKNVMANLDGFPYL